MHNRRIVTTLNHLVARALDSEYTLLTCAGRTLDPSLRILLRHRAEQSQASISELQALVREFGGTPRTNGTTSADFRRLLLTARGWVFGESEAALLAECERVQTQVMEACRATLNAPLPADVRRVVLRAFEGSQRCRAAARSGQSRRPRSTRTMQRA